MKHMSQTDKAKAIAWKLEKVPHKVIASRLEVSLSSVARLLAQYRKQKGENIPERKKGTGRNKKGSKKIISIIKKTIEKNPFLTSREIKKKHKVSLDDISERTIRRICKEDLDLPSFVAANKTLLTKSMKTRRTVFAKGHKSWSKKKWSKVLYSDESIFQTIQNRKGRVRRKKGSDRFSPKYVSTYVRHPAQLMVWASVSSQGPGRLEILKPSETITAQRYVDVLKKNLKPSYKKTDTNILLQDLARPHIAKLSQKYLEDNEIEVINLPGNSSDMNPIEHVFSVMKAALLKEDTSTVDKLRRLIKRVWRKIDPETVAKICGSMRDRMSEVLKKNGSYTKY